MIILEAVILLSLIMLALSVGLLLIKFAVFMIVLPIKLMFWLTKGLLGLIIAVPLLLLLGALLMTAVPIGVLLLVLPVLVLGGVTCKLVAC